MWWQVLADFITRPTFEEEGDGALGEEDTAEWYDAAYRFLRENTAPVKGKDTRPKRLSSWEWRCCVDNTLKISTGLGLDRFVYTRSPSQDSRIFGPRPWKILALIV